MTSQVVSKILNLLLGLNLRKDGKRHRMNMSPYLSSAEFMYSRDNIFLKCVVNVKWFQVIVDYSFTLCKVLD